jgi:hypothetical protein
MKQQKDIISGSEELRKRLPRGAIQALCNKYGYSWMWVHKLVTGRANGNPLVILDARVMAKMEDERRAHLEKLSLRS